MKSTYQETKETGASNRAMKKLPVEEVLPQLKQTISCFTNTILVAPPGSGKTTRLPLALLKEPWLGGKKILMLEPRRLAARAAARHMADLLGEKTGETVGYRIRMDRCISAKTRIEVITEGILTRMLQGDPGLEEAGIVIFDEFHERSMHADLGLALCLEAQSILRENLRILVMSATLDVEPLSSLLGGAPVVTSEASAFPVSTYYIPRPLTGRLEPAVAKKIKEAISEREGDILVFLPGAGEIRRVEAELSHIGMQQEAVITRLYGGMSQEEQELAILPHPEGKRKIVLATSIAQTSITVEGIRIVIDSGFMRIPSFSSRTGMTHLKTVKVSQDVSNQRRGRAGRLAPGVCYRLWTLQEEQAHEPNCPPEIMEADISSLVLELAAWGVKEPEELRWLDLPPRAAVVQVKQLLSQLGALDASGRITGHGQQIVKTGLHPRIAHMIVRSLSLGYGKIACEMAAILDQRDFLKGLPDADLSLRIEILHQRRRTVFSPYEVDLGALKAVQRESDYLQQLFSVAGAPTGGQDVCGLLLAFAYPERIAQGRGDGRFLLRNGHGAVLKGEQVLAKEPYLVAAVLGGDTQREKIIFLAASFSLKLINEFFPEQIEVRDIMVWDSAVKAVRAWREEKLDGLLLKYRPLAKCEPDKICQALLEGILEEGLQILPWNKHSFQLHQRLRFMHRIDSGWPDVSDSALRSSLAEWLGPYIEGVSCYEQLQQLNLSRILESMLSWEQKQRLNEWAPTHILVPSGQRIPVDYSDCDMPVLAVRLQEMFGLQDTPCIGQGRVVLTLHLLSPAHRTVQVTKDLSSFWGNTYFQIRKDLLGRYPKHYWPDDPLKAAATHRTRPRI